MAAEVGRVPAGSGVGGGAGAALAGNLVLGRCRPDRLMPGQPERRDRQRRCRPPAECASRRGATPELPDTTDFPEVSRGVADEHADFGPDPDNASYFVSRITLRRTNQPDMVTWRKALFIALAHNAPSQAEFLSLPSERTIVLSGDVPM